MPLCNNVVCLSCESYVSYLIWSLRNIWVNLSSNSVWNIVPIVYREMNLWVCICYLLIFVIWAFVFLPYYFFFAFASFYLSVCRPFLLRLFFFFLILFFLYNHDNMSICMPVSLLSLFLPNKEQNLLFCHKICHMIILSVEQNTNIKVRMHKSVRPMHKRVRPGLKLFPNYRWNLYTVRPLFKKITQHCETYEPTNCCVRKLHILCTILHNLCTILYKLCNFFYTTVGRFICFTVLCNFLNSGLTV